LLILEFSQHWITVELRSEYGWSRFVVDGKACGIASDGTPLSVRFLIRLPYVFRLFRPHPTVRHIYLFPDAFEGLGSAVTRLDGLLYD
jgi:hypothetical protein